MSKIGRIPITIPAGVKFNVKADCVTVEGPKGALTQKYDPIVSVFVDGDKAVVERKGDSKKARSFHGLYRQLFCNMITGVTEGFSKVLIINGVGYRAEVKGDILVLALGYSTEFNVLIPKGIEVKVEPQGKIVISGISKDLVGEFAAQIRRLRLPEPYKGKGIRYEAEIIKRKVGKTGVK